MQMKFVQDAIAKNGDLPGVNRIVKLTERKALR